MDDEWSPLGNMAGQSDVDLPFDLCILLERIEESEPQLQITETAHAEFVRKLLRISNLLRFKDSVDKMIDYLGSGPCLTLSSGTLPDRLQAILNAVSE